MKKLLLLLILCLSASAADKFVISRAEVTQILDDSTALCNFKNETVLISGINFRDAADGDTIRSKCHGVWDGNYSYTNVLGQRRTVRKITVVDNGERR